jgi:hypothetical protein
MKYFETLVKIIINIFYGKINQTKDDAVSIYKKNSKKKTIKLNLLLQFFCNVAIFNFL